jgi:hypothetical protein
MLSVHCSPPFLPLLSFKQPTNPPSVCRPLNVDSLAWTELDFDVQLDFRIPAGSLHVMIPPNGRQPQRDDDGPLKGN